MNRFFLTLCLAGLLSPVLRADVALPALFGDGMVLQRERPVSVWGRADPGENISVRFAGQERRTQASRDGEWQIEFDSLAASAEPRDLIVAGENTIALHDVLVGEVWLCSGQSNMEMALGVPAAGARAESSFDPALAAELPTMAYPKIRLFRVSQKSRADGDLRSDGWAEARGEALAKFSAAGFFFGRELHAALGVPIGLVSATWGGSRLEEWISDAAYAPLEEILGADAPRCFERDPSIVSRNYDVMIAPLTRFPLRGVLWYQGEANVIFYNDGLRYADKFAALVASWRAAWHDPALPFYAVQIAPFSYTDFPRGPRRGPDELPKFWEAQHLSTTIPHTGLVPISDTVVDVKNIHPGGKSVVGHRLAALVLARTYGRDNEIATGPLFRRVTFRGATAIVEFDGAAGGLATRDGNTPDHFELAGADGEFHPAAATLHGDMVELTAPAVPSPTAVRFAWHETARPNLVNHAGWPAFPFRSNGPAWHPPQLPK